MSATIFITRDIQPDSPIQKLTDYGFKVSGHSLINITPIPFTLENKGHWIFFYSQHGVEAYMEHAGVDTLRNCQLAAFGPKTAKRLRQQDLPVAFTGNGRAESSARAFRKLALGQSVVFARAKQSMRSIQKELAGAIQAIDLIVYDNDMKTDIDLPTSDILIFTSPLNVRSYLNHRAISSGETVIAIGPSTSQALRDHGYSKVLIPTRPAEEEIVNLILSRTKEIL